MLTDMVFGTLVEKTLGDIEWRGAEARRVHIRNAINLFLFGVCPRTAPAQPA